MTTYLKTQNIMQPIQYDKLTDEEIIERLVKKPTDNKLHEYFLNTKCYNFLSYISQNLYNEDTIYHLTGEFYEFISRNDWYVLRMWRKENNCSLYSYLSRCATNHFTALVKADKKRSEIEFVPATPEFTDYINNLSAEEPERDYSTTKAFKMLKERDQIVLRMMVIEDCDAIKVAPKVWKFINSKEDYRSLPVKKVQNTIASIKHRALIAMQNNIYKLGID